MWTAYEFMILGTVLLFSSLSVPSIHYVIARKFTDQLGENSSPDFRPSVTLLLPMRNESSNVERKILESLSLEYPEEKLKIIVVDSCSVDDTAIIARGLLGGRGVVISLERPGKSLAINSALDIIDTDFFAMMDADAICPPDSLSKLIEWFADPEIGAVCGRQCDEYSERDPYRKRFNILRVGESIIDSTPIFEGSLCCFRMAAIGSNRINPRINADDSQLAMISRACGFRSIMDPRIQFSENQPISRSRKVRRSQGLCRALISRLDLLWGEGWYSAFLFSSIFFYVLMPWLVLSSVLCYFYALIIGGDYISQITQLLSPVLITLLALVFLTNFGRNFLSGLTILFEAHIRLFVGQTLEIWDPNR